MYCHVSVELPVFLHLPTFSMGVHYRPVVIMKERNRTLQKSNGQPEKYVSKRPVEQGQAMADSSSTIVPLVRAFHQVCEVITS